MGVHRRYYLVDKASRMLGPFRHRKDVDRILFFNNSISHVLHVKPKYSIPTRQYPLHLFSVRG